MLLTGVKDEEGFPSGSSGKEPACQHKRAGFHPWVGKLPWRRARQPTPVFLPAESHGQRSLEGYRPLDCKESYKTEHAQEEGEVLAPSHDILLGKSQIYINLLASSLIY